MDQGGLRRTVVGAAGIEVVGAAGIEDDQRRAEVVAAADILRMEVEAAAGEDSRRRVVVGPDWGSHICAGLEGLGDLVGEGLREEAGVAEAQPAMVAGDQQAVAEAEGLRLQRVPEQSRVVPWAAVVPWKVAWGATQTVEVAGQFHL